jgi:hypothetical protein
MILFFSYFCPSSFDDVVRASLNFGSRMLRGAHVQGWCLVGQFLAGQCVD